MKDWSSAVSWKAPAGIFVEVNTCVGGAGRSGGEGADFSLVGQTPPAIPAVDNRRAGGSSSLNGRAAPAEILVMLGLCVGGGAASGGEGAGLSLAGQTLPAMAIVDCCGSGGSSAVSCDGPAGTLVELGLRVGGRGGSGGGTSTIAVRDARCTSGWYSPPPRHLVFDPDARTGS